MLKHGILGLLSYGSKTGWDVVQLFKKTLNYFWNAQTSQIYRELATLEQHGWAKSSQEDGSSKKVYTITDAGKAELERWLAEDDFRLQVNKPLLMKVFFLAETNAAARLEFLKAARDECSRYLASLAPVKDQIAADKAGDGDRAIFWRMSEEYGRRNLEMTVEWLDECIAILEESDEHTVD